MTIETIKKDIMQNYPLYRIVDKKASKAYPRTLWLYRKNPKATEARNNAFISDDEDMMINYQAFKQFYK